MNADMLVELLCDTESAGKDDCAMSFINELLAGQVAPRGENLTFVARNDDDWELSTADVADSEDFNVCRRNGSGLQEIWAQVQVVCNEEDDIWICVTNYLTQETFYFEVSVA